MNTVSDSDTRIKVLCGKDIRETLVSTLTRTEPKRIRLISYLLDDVGLIDNITIITLLSQIAMRGATVSIVVGQLPKEEVKKKILNLRKFRFGINVFYNRRAHSKLVLVEGKTENCAIIMSANITHGGLYYNYEVGVLLEDLSEDAYWKLRQYTNEILGDEYTEDLVRLYG